MKSCLSLVKDMNTAEVIPAKQVIDAALTFHKKGRGKHKSYHKGNMEDETCFQNEIND